MRLFITKKRLDKLQHKARRAGVQDRVEQELIDKVDDLQEQEEAGRSLDASKVLESSQEDFPISEAFREADRERAFDMLSKKFAKESFWTKLVETTKDLVYSIANDIKFEQARLYRIMQRSAAMYREDVLVRATGNLVRRSVIGNGVTFSTGNADVDKYLKDFWSARGVNMEFRQKEIGLHSYLLGEYFLVYFINSNSKRESVVPLPDIDIRKFFPWEIKEVLTKDDDDEFIIGITRAADSAGTDVETYNLIGAYLDPDRWKDLSPAGAKENVYVQFIRMSDGFDIRGYPQMFPMLRWATIIKELVYDIASKFHEWSKVLYILKVNRKDKAWRDDTARRAPKGGTVLVSSPDAQWDKFESKFDAQGIEKVWEVLLYYFAAGIGFPYQFVVQDYSNNNYASGREARIPLNQLIQDLQNPLGKEFVTVLQVGVKAGVAAGILKKRVRVPRLKESTIVAVMDEVCKILREEHQIEKRVSLILPLIKENVEHVSVDTETIPITVEFPKPPILSEKERAEVLKIYREVGIDDRSIAELAGFNWETIVARKLAQVDLDITLRKRYSQATDQGDDVMPDDDAGIPPGDENQDGNEG